MKSCKNAERYQGIFPPRCNGGDPCDSCKEKYQMRHGGQVNEALAALMSNTRDEILDVPVRPLNITFPKPAQRSEGNLITALLWGDTHFPNQSDESLAIVHAVAQDIQPHFLIHMGDLIDATDLSEKFKKNPARKETLQDEINMGRTHLAHMRQAVPDAKFVLLEGNHEERMKRVLWNMEGPAKALSVLTEVNKAMSWPVLLGLAQLDIEFIPYGEQSKHLFLPKFLVKHGSVIRQNSSYTAHAEWRKYGKSGASGHTHRLGQFYHRDLNGNQLWLETGCTCKLEAEYAPDSDWQNGFVIMTFEPTTGAFQAETIYIHNGFAVCREKKYGARPITKE